MGDGNILELVTKPCASCLYSAQVIGKSGLECTQEKCFYVYEPGTDANAD
jgi:hypothetical protein